LLLCILIVLRPARTYERSPLRERHSYRSSSISSPPFALIVVVSITATAATVTPITADVVVAAPVSSPQVVDDPERDLRAGGSIDIGGAREVEDEAAVAQVSVGAKPIPGDMRPWASVVPCPRNRLPVAAPFPACKVTYWRATV
jgi:hypothetical protein